jgi:hypothetical protein
MSHIIFISFSVPTRLTLNYSPDHRDVLLSTTMDLWNCVLLAKSPPRAWFFSRCHSVRSMSPIGLLLLSRGPRRAAVANARRRLVIQPSMKRALTFPSAVLVVGPTRKWRTVTNSWISLRWVRSPSQMALSLTSSWETCSSRSNRVSLRR